MPIRPFLAIQVHQQGVSKQGPSFGMSLPKDICIKSIRKVKLDAHCRFDALSRTYEYIINKSKNPFLVDKAYFLNKCLDVDEMNKAANCLFDFIDFTSFSKLHTQTKTNNCKIKKAVWEQRGETLVFIIQARWKYAYF